MSAPVAFPPPTLVPLDDVVLEVFHAGDPRSGRPIVLCHGWPELAHSWRHQIPALVAAGHHVIVPNQRGFGGSSCPADVAAYGLDALAGDLMGLLDHFGHARATFVGHDWGAMVVWGLALLHPDRVERVANLALPYQERGDVPWIEQLEQLFGPDHYFVHFNRQPGVAEAVLDRNVGRFLGNLFRRDLPPGPPAPGVWPLCLAEADTAPGTPLLGADELAVYEAAFEATGFGPGIHWYRNLDRNWRLLGTVNPVVRQPALMIHGDRDSIPRSPRLSHFVPDVEVVGLDCGHWIQQERPAETTALLLDWLARTAARAAPTA